MQLDQAAERIESLKAGILAATAAAIGGFCLNGIYLFLLAQIHLTPTVNNSLLTDLSEEFSLNLTPWLKALILLLSGFLFGVTYRYIVRQDDNPQLKAGAVMAFGLIRGLAQAEAKLDQGQLTTIMVSKVFANAELWQIGVGIVESVILFALAAVVLDQAIDRGWIKTFTTF